MVVVLVVVGIVSVTGGGSGDESEISDTRVGAVLPVTGPGAFFGEQLRNGMKLANQEVGHNLYIEDSETDPSTGVSAFQNLNSQHGLDIGVVAFSSVANAVLPKAEESGVPTIHTVVSASKVAAKSPQSFRYFTSGEQESPIIAEFAHNQLDIDTAGIIYPESEYGQSYQKAFQDSFTSMGGEVVVSESFPSRANDFRTQLTRIRSANPDAVLVVGLNKQLVTMLKQIEEMNINSTVLTNWILASPSVQDEVGDSDEGVYFTTPSYYLSSDDQTEESKGFREQYRKKYDDNPSAYAAIGFDIVKLIERARERQVQKSPNGLTDALRNIKNFEAVMGELQVDSEGEITFPLYPAVIEDQSVKRVE